MVDVKALLAKITTMLDAPIIYREFTSGSVTLAAHASASVSIPFTVPSGYKTLCATPTRSNGSIMPSYPLTPGVDSVTVWIRNASTGSLSGTITVGLLFVKNP